MIVHDVIKEVDDGKPGELKLSALRRVLVHRTGKDLKIGIDLGDTAIEICSHFTGKNDQYPEVAKATGGQIAYSFMIGGDLGAPEFDGVIWQTLPLSDVGHHAMRFSTTAVGVAVIADPRVKAISPKQRRSLLWLDSRLIVGLEISPSSVLGHDELPGAYRDPLKSCPGDLLSMFEVRRELVEGPREEAIQEMTRAGIVV